MLGHTRQTSPGEPTVGTTFVDETSPGSMPGEIAELEAPHTILFHWWETSTSGKLEFEGWPSYRLQPAGDNETQVRHRGTRSTRSRRLSRTPHLPLDEWAGPAQDASVRSRSTPPGWAPRWVPKR